MKPTNPAGDPALAALEWLHQAEAEQEIAQAVAQRLRRRRARRVAIGATLLVALGIGAWTLRSPVPSKTAPSGAPAIASAAPTSATVTQPARQLLSDGTTVELKDDAEIAVQFGAEARRVTLVRGEAHFSVAKNSDWPFIVRAGAVEVRAVGTAFSVELAAQAVDVLVTEGTVRVTPDAAKSTGRPAALVDADHRCVVRAADAVTRVENVSLKEAEDRLAWRIPQLEFSRTPLPEVVALMNRHVATASHPVLTIADSELSQIKLTGFLRADNVEGLVRLLETNFKVIAERSAEQIALKRAK